MAVDCCSMFLFVPGGDRLSYTVQMFYGMEKEERKLVPPEGRGDRLTAQKMEQKHSEL